MRKIALCLSAIVIMLSFISCEISVDYKFLHDPSEISTIEIVDVLIGESSEGLKQETVCVIHDIDMFMDDFSQVDCYYIYTDPTGIEKDTTAIKIIYSNGEYELIAASGQAEYTNERQFSNYRGYRYFDKKQFEDLILKYTHEQVESSNYTSLCSFF